MQLVGSGRWRRNASTEHGAGRSPHHGRQIKNWLTYLYSRIEPSLPVAQSLFKLDQTEV